MLTELYTAFSDTLGVILLVRASTYSYVNTRVLSVEVLQKMAQKKYQHSDCTYQYGTSTT
jgi:hypothetical protein